MKKEHQTTGRGGALVRVGSLSFFLLHRLSSILSPLSPSPLSHSSPTQLELHHAITGAKITERFKTSDSLEVIHLRHTQHQFLYLEDNRIHLLDPETYEQVEMDASTISGGEASLALLQDGMPVTVQSLEGVGPLAFSLPDQFSYQVEADDFKGKQGAKGVGQKTVELAGGRLRVRVPEFIKVGEWIIVELPEGKYVGRGKLDAPA
ncbi:hypothetical protein BJ684DRAFT_10176 [Piptocephalis cylindrospora]|uniref:Uncharacterized protein n=1 Tax=Piptocephalis cylindrospora TaxID=1907219 RepID=A0A4P9Y390_9FUNG|nr:hypothetical protein BJ684DRAFT_10176 [Piptocephalis cylindrospora]|eukprot:RKP13357.1 hypothetical protein BJ684DRAFT_10176 [Piptocephalis cylindrospora]